MITKIVEVTHIVEVKVDETKLDVAFMEEFRKYFYDFENLDAHLEYLAISEVRGYIRGFPESLEGYGEIKQLGISIEVQDSETLIAEL